MKPYPQRSLTPNPSPGGEGSRCIVVMVVFKIEGNRNNINNYECASPNFNPIHGYIDSK